MNRERLLGLDDNSVVFVDQFKQFLHPDVVIPLQELSSDAEQFGFQLTLASGYRNFSRQLFIWNQKASGMRVVLDSSGLPLELMSLTDDEKLWAILRWSALPGSSRHHWGTDVDVYDRSKIDSDYQLQLTVKETEEGGPFAEFHHWLTRKLTEKNCPFYRPFWMDRGGVAPEPWHLSYAPLSNIYSSQFSVDLLREQLEQTDILLKESILNHLDEIFERFIKIN
jgi:LAS superfamily LD-carboxypeptidase LdcB